MYLTQVGYVPIPPLRKRKLVLMASSSWLTDCGIQEIVKSERDLISINLHYSSHIMLVTRGN